MWSDSEGKSEIDHEKNDMDIDIHNKRMLYILDDTIKKIKLMSVFELDRKEHKSIISAEESKAILAIKERYEKIKTEERESLIWNEDINVYEGDPELAHILMSLDSNEKLKTLIDSIGNRVSPAMVKFRNVLKDLRNNVEQYIKFNVAQDKARDKYNRRCQMKNDHIKKEIANIEKELVEKKSDLTASIIGKNMMVNRHYAKIDKIQKGTQEAIEKRLEEAQSAIAVDQEATLGIQDALKNELADTTQKYNSLLAENLNTEKQFRMARAKVENQLAAFIAKFDQDIGEKQAEEEQMQAEFEEAKRQYEEIQKKLDEQEEEFEELMLEKAAYEQELLEQKLFIFILNRSARRIQRAYRAYRLNKAQKKKPGKGKGKGKGKKKK